LRSPVILLQARQIEVMKWYSRGSKREQQIAGRIATRQLRERKCRFERLHRREL